METQSSLVRADGGTVLNPVATIHLNFAMVIDPGHAENDDALRYEQALKQAIFGINGILLDIGPQRFHDFGQRLHIFRLVLTLCFNALQETFQR